MTKSFFLKPLFDYFLQIESNDLFLNHIALEISQLLIYNTFCPKNYRLEDIKR